MKSSAVKFSSAIWSCPFFGLLLAAVFLKVASGGIFDAFNEMENTATSVGNQAKNFVNSQNNEVKAFVDSVSNDVENMSEQAKNDLEKFMNDNTPVTLLKDLADTDVEEKDVTFIYYNRDVPAGEVFTVSEVSETKLHKWRKNTPLKMITHGWTTSAQHESVQLIKNAYLEEHDFNIIAVDWSGPAKNEFYPIPAYNTRFVGRFVAKLIMELINRSFITFDLIHCIGFSLGAQVMGVAGGAIEGGKIGRISGLDPAGPGFSQVSLPHKLVLDDTDAKFVDVIHTAAGYTSYGYPSSLGHVDFYPNGGRHKQPGCEDVSCSHARAFHLYAESIKNIHAFKAWKCDNWELFLDKKCDNNPTEYMGDATPANARGDYYLTTKDKPPFGNDEQ